MTADIIDFPIKGGSIMSPPLDPGQFFAELEKIGEDEVRLRLAHGHVYGSDKVPFVEEWLRRKDQDHKEASNREQIEIAREATAAARAAARAALSAANTAKIMAIIAAISITISVIIRFL